jgi:cytochrome c biogenesis protein CcdA/thiol-disulfide isomerase/thioredoxin
VLELLVIGFVAGLVAGISPCILPVLPVVLVAGATGESVAVRRRRSLAVVLGLVLSFSAVTLGGSALLSLLGLPQDLLRDAGLVVLGLIGVGLLVPAVGQLLERPFSHIRLPQPTGRGASLVLGLGLGAVFVPCAGPVLAAISVIAATRHVSFEGVVLTLLFAAGAAVPLLVVALAGDQLVSRARALRERAPLMRMVGGAVMVVMALVIGFNLTDGLQRSVPGYTSALQKDVEGSGTTAHELNVLKGSTGGSLSSCKPGDSALEECGAAPAFKGITAWLNTSGDKPLPLASLRGKVALVDFWTYSCINCQRTLPHVEAWYRAYAPDGFVVVGVETPEFAFEHVVSNVASAAASLGVRYPVAVDDDYDTWNAYDNQYWPAEYLIDADGQVRHVDFGEGGYGQTETLIRTLLVDANPAVKLPPPTDVPNRTPTEPVNPETYVGYDRLQYIDAANVVPGKAATYSFPASLPPGYFGLSGEWTIGAEEATAGENAQLELGIQAKDVYLVLSGSGTMTVSFDGGPPKSVSVGGIPGLYTLFSSSSLTNGTLVLNFTPGLEAYDFTFG